MTKKNPNAELDLYCHVPFCAAKCDFCAFYQEKPKRGDIENYLNAIEQELAMAPPPRPAETFFWGGGTPGILSANALLRLGKLFLGANKMAPLEWTVEMAPFCVTDEKLAVLKELGVTRISLGVQSFDAQTLGALGRLHSPRQIFSAWEILQKFQFNDTALDLIFAVPGQDEQRWHSDLQQAVSLAPSHISTYCLTFEEDTALFVKLAKGRVSIDAERDAALYRGTWEFLEKHGFAQYEISNFARDNRICRHNVNTWKMREWLGYGPAAASQFQWHRWQNPANLERWRSGVISGKPVREQVVELTPAMLFSDAIIFGLRMNAGVDLENLEKRFGEMAPVALEKFGKNLVEENFLKIQKRRWQLTLEGRLRADAIGAGVLDFF